MLGNPNTPQGERSLEDTEKESEEEGATLGAGEEMWMKVVFRGVGTGLIGLVPLGRFGFVPRSYAGASCLQVCIPEISQVCTRATQLDLGAEMLACNGDVP